MKEKKALKNVSYFLSNSNVTENQFSIQENSEKITFINPVFIYKCTSDNKPFDVCVSI